MVLEYGGTSLLQVIQVDGPLSSHSVSVLSLQLQAALQALHAISVLHLDVKLGNILWIKETLQMKLTDFGMAELFGVAACELRFSEYVSAPYRPPDLLKFPVLLPKQTKSNVLRTKRSSCLTNMKLVLNNCCHKRPSKNQGCSKSN